MIASEVKGRGKSGGQKSSNRGRKQGSKEDRIIEEKETQGEEEPVKSRWG